MLKEAFPEHVEFEVIPSFAGIVLNIYSIPKLTCRILTISSYRKQQ